MENYKIIITAASYTSLHDVTSRETILFLRIEETENEKQNEKVKKIRVWVKEIIRLN
jgi:hypothetical protein